MSSNIADGGGASFFAKVSVKPYEFTGEKSKWSLFPLGLWVTLEHILAFFFVHLQVSRFALFLFFFSLAAKVTLENPPEPCSPKFKKKKKFGSGHSFLQGRNPFLLTIVPPENAHIFIPPALIIIFSLKLFHKSSYSYIFMDFKQHF